MKTLRELRKAKGDKTLAAVASECGIGLSSLSQLERGQRSMTPRYAEILSKYYGVEILPFDVEYVPKILNDETPVVGKPDYYVYQKLNSELKLENRKLYNENTKLRNLLYKLKRQAAKTYHECVTIEKELLTLPTQEGGEEDV